MGMDCLGALCDKLFNNSCVDVREAGNGHEIWVPKVNRRFDEWMRTVKPRVLLFI